MCEVWKQEEPMLEDNFKFCFALTLNQKEQLEQREHWVKRGQTGQQELRFDVPLVLESVQTQAQVSDQPLVQVSE